jgi:hypothetical protein
VNESGMSLADSENLPLAIVVCIVDHIAHTNRKLHSPSIVGHDRSLDRQTMSLAMASTLKLSPSL